MKLTTKMIAGLALIASPLCNATVITHGNLTTDDATQVITDTTTGRMYTRFDAFNKTYADTLTSLLSGNTYDGWSAVTSSIADEFIATVLGLGSTPCDGNVAYGTACGTISGWSDGNFGSSYDSFYDYFGYLGAASSPIGLVEFNSNGLVEDYEDWSTVASLDSYPTINLLLYKQGNFVSDVPEPSIIALFGAGLMGLGFVGRFKARQ